MPKTAPEFVCERCGIIGDHMRVKDPMRCRGCCTVDAAEDLLAACETALLIIHARHAAEVSACRDMVCRNLRAAIAKARVGEA